MRNGSHTHTGRGKNTEILENNLQLLLCVSKESAVFMFTLPCLAHALVLALTLYHAYVFFCQLFHGV